MKTNDMISRRNQGLLEAAWTSGNHYNIENALCIAAKSNKGLADIIEKVAFRLKAERKELKEIRNTNRAVEQR